MTGVDGQAEFRGKRLLLVDDEERILSALRRSLRREGFEILVAATVDRALEILQHEPIDLILSDHMMPGMTGIELLDEARRRQPEAVRMLISGWSQAVSAEELEELGVAVLVSKPWDDSELKQAIRKLLA